MDKWDKRFLDLAKLISTWSKDPSTQVGAVLTNGNEIVCVGYNGFPRGISDDERLLDREYKLSIILHAEENVLLKGQAGDTIYTYPFLPCSRCASKIIQVGIKRVVSYINDNERWRDNFMISEGLFKEAGVKLVLYGDSHGATRTNW